jgi:hypothetical protein
MVLNIEYSGLYTAESGRTFLVTQGLSGNTLVAGKRTLIQTFVSASELNQIDSMNIRLVGPPRGVFYITIPKNWLTFESNSANGPSVRVTLVGDLFRLAAQFLLVIWFDNIPGNFASFYANFRPTKDLRILIVPLQGSSPTRNFLPTPAWYEDADRAMVRLGSMYPVRDGVHRGLDHGNAGIRYDFTQPMEAWPSEVGLPPQDYLTETNRINSQGGNVDHVDVSVLYRPHQLNEDVGGNANYCGVPRVPQCITGESNGVTVTAPIFAQEIGHTFCLEPPTSPHDDGGRHSLDPDIFDPYAYDFVNNRFYVYPTAPGQGLGDAMSWAYRRGNDLCALNTYDWEYLRDKLNGLDSTGTNVNRSTFLPTKEPYVFTAKKKYEKMLTVPRNTKMQWDWTSDGIKPVLQKKAINRRQRITPRLQNFLEKLAESGVDKVYVPINGKPFTIIESSQSDAQSLYRDDFRITE